MTEPSSEELMGLPAKWLDRATLLIVDYEGAQDEDVEEAIFEILQPIVHPDGARVLCYAETHPSEPAFDEPVARLLRFDGPEDAPTGISNDAWMAYRQAKERKELEYDRARLGYWVGRVRERGVLVVVGLD